MDERELIGWLQHRIPRGRGVLRGIGDDAAVLRGFPGRVLFTCDMLLEGTHFLPSDPPAALGWKSLACSLSDIAAMAGKPVAAVVSLGLRRGLGDRWIRAFYRGLLRCARTFGCPVVGGDTTAGRGPVVVDVAVLGNARRPALRSAARPGDAILVTGTLGGSILGRHLRFRPRIREAWLLARRFRVHAMMDISDGLSLDLSRILEESRVGAVLFEEAIPISQAARRLAARDGRSSLEHALSDGEDYELLFTIPQGAATTLLARKPLGVRVSRIGRVTRAGFFLRRRDGRLEPAQPTGWVHRI